MTMLMLKFELKFMVLFIAVAFFISILANFNWSLMDFIEGESELMSGFNVEYFSSGFTLIFLAEYEMIIFVSIVFTLLFSSLLFSNMMLFMMCFVSLFFHYFGCSSSTSPYTVW